jgi:crotonobetainyl-CoA:carnitine CoA-transferase CaiB-like acyl-CoA transferase
VSEALESTQADVNKMVLEQDHPTVGKFRTLGIPYSFSKNPAKISSSPPLLGADTDDILLNIVGLETKEIKKLRNDGVV